MMSGPIVRQLCTGGKTETSKQKIDRFHFFFSNHVFLIYFFSDTGFATIAKYSGHAWNLFGANIS